MTMNLCIFHSQDDIDDSDEVESAEDETEDESDDEGYDYEGENGNVLNRSDEGDDSSNGFII